MEKWTIPPRQRLAPGAHRRTHALVLETLCVNLKSEGHGAPLTAIPKLLDMLAIEGAIVTIDAMGCQRHIAQKIVDKKADYRKRCSAAL
jgi:hypothetical protein